MIMACASEEKEEEGSGKSHDECLNGCGLSKETLPLVGRVSFLGYL